MRAAAQGAKVVFADIDPRTLNLDPAAVAAQDHAAHQGDFARAPLWPVLRHGRAAWNWRRARGIVIIEDCAHAAGAEYKGRKAGSLGDIGVFSFHQQKNMVTLGEGGHGHDQRTGSFTSACCLTARCAA